MTKFIEVSLTGQSRGLQEEAPRYLINIDKIISFGSYNNGSFVILEDIGAIDIAEDFQTFSDRLTDSGHSEL